VRKQRQGLPAGGITQLRVARGGEVAVPVERRPGYSERCSDLGRALAAGETSCCDRELVGVDTGPATDPAVGTGRRESGHGALVNDVAFQFGERRHHGEELALPGGCIGSGDLAAGAGITSGIDYGARFTAEVSKFLSI